MTRQQQLLDIFKRILVGDRIRMKTLELVGLNEMNLRTYGFSPEFTSYKDQWYWKFDTAYLPDAWRRRTYKPETCPFEELRRKMRQQGIGEEFEAAEVLVSLERS